MLKLAKVANGYSEVHVYSKRNRARTGSAIAVADGKIELDLPVLMNKAGDDDELRSTRRIRFKDNWGKHS